MILRSADAIRREVAREVEVKIPDGHPGPAKTRRVVDRVILAWPLPEGAAVVHVQRLGMPLRRAAAHTPGGAMFAYVLDGAELQVQELRPPLSNDLRLTLEGSDG